MVMFNRLARKAKEVFKSVCLLRGLRLVIRLAAGFSGGYCIALSALCKKRALQPVFLFALEFYVINPLPQVKVWASNKPFLIAISNASACDDAFCYTSAYVDCVADTEKLKEPDALLFDGCLLYTSPSPRDRQKSRMPSSA